MRCSRPTHRASGRRTGIVRAVRRNLSINSTYAITWKRSTGTSSPRRRRCRWRFRGGLVRSIWKHTGPSRGANSRAESRRMNALDWAILGVVALSVALAASHGFFFEVFSLAGAVVGYLAAAWGYGRLATLFA